MPSGQCCRDADRVCGSKCCSASQACSNSKCIKAVQARAVPQPAARSTQSKESNVYNAATCNPACPAGTRCSNDQCCEKDACCKASKVCIGPSSYGCCPDDHNCINGVCIGPPGSAVTQLNRQQGVVSSSVQEPTIITLQQQVIVLAGQGRQPSSGGPGPAPAPGPPGVVYVPVPGPVSQPPAQQGCPQGQTSCSGACCGGGMQCDRTNGNCCPVGYDVQPGGGCCPSGQNRCGQFGECCAGQCMNGQCCKVGTTPCGTLCCPENTVCCDNVCCQPGQTCCLAGQSYRGQYNFPTPAAVVAIAKNTCSFRCQ